MQTNVIISTVYYNLKIIMQKSGPNRIVTISPSSKLKNGDKTQKSQKQIKNKTKFSILNTKNTQNTQNTQKQIKYGDRISNNQDQLNKTLTPLKLQQSSKHTRTSTSLKNTQKITKKFVDQLIDGDDNNSPVYNQVTSTYSAISQYSNNVESNFHRFSKPTSKDLEYNNDIGPSYLKQQKARRQERTVQKTDISQIIKKINGNNYEPLTYNNPSICLQKKMEVNRLRSMLNRGKQFLCKQNNTYGSKFCYGGLNLNINKANKQSGTIDNLNQLKMTLRQKLSAIFRQIHQLIDEREKQLCQNLQQKFYEYKQKEINKIYRVDGLKIFIEKCQTDVNTNYKQIVEQLDIDKFKDIVNTYIDRFKYHMKKVQTDYRLQLDISNKLYSNIGEQLQKIEFKLMAKEYINPVLDQRVQNIDSTKCQPNSIKNQRMNCYKNSTLSKSFIDLASQNYQQQTRSKQQLRIQSSRNS